MTKKIQRTDKEANSDLIRSACITILQRTKGRKPTIKELSGETGLSESSVKRHIKTMRFVGRPDEACTLRVLTDDVKISLYRAAMKGNVAAARLWFMIVEGWTERTETKIDADVRVDNNKPPVIIHIQ